MDFAPSAECTRVYDLDTVNSLSQLLKDQTVTSGQEAITITLPGLCGMVIKENVCDPNILQNRSVTEGNPVVLRGSNVTAVLWVNRCGGSRDIRASLAMILRGRLEITTGWSHVAKHIYPRSTERNRRRSF